jgi:peptidoglycan/xylan/chitin deacetylase (PgdA/CDA1 family)
MRLVDLSLQLKARAQSILRSFYPQAVILMYHRVADLSVDPYEIAVSPHHFRDQMDYLQQNCYPMRFLDFVDAVQQRSIPPRAVVVTFDDGYVDNYENALPVLEEAQVPATVFVTTGNLGTDREFWWDTLERVLLQPQYLPEYLQLEIDGFRQEWHVKTPEQRLQAHQSIHRRMRALSAFKREQVLGGLTQWAELDQISRPGYRAVNGKELSKLAESKMIDIGAHTVSHPALPLLSFDDQYDEIVSSRQKLEKLTDRPVVAFSYPFGKHSEDTIDLLKAAGFRAACTTSPKAVTPGERSFSYGPLHGN